MSVLSACVTKPKTIDDVYLSEIISVDAEKLRKIEENIVSLKKDKDKSEAENTIAEQVIAVSESEVSMLEAAGRHFQEREKLYSLMVDNQKLGEEQAKLVKNRDELTQAKSNLKLNEARRDEAEALLEMKKAELAVKIAELDYEKAKIAKEYQAKRPEKIEKDKIIDDTEYEKFLNSQIAELDKKVEKHQKAMQMVEKIKSGKMESK
jgi:hypothetical protein